MSFLLDGVRRIVLLVLVVEFVLQLQSGKQYEPYLKMLTGIMVAYSLVSVVLGSFGQLDKKILGPMESFQWKEAFTEGADYYEEEAQTGETEEAAKALEVEIKVAPVEEIVVEPIVIGKGE